LYTTASIFIEIFKLFQTCFIISPSIASRCNNLVVRKAAFNIPTRKVIGSLNYQKQRDTLTFSIDTNNWYSLFPITRLYSFASATSIGACNNHTNTNNAYHKASLVEIIKIIVQNIILGLYILYQPEPRPNMLRTFSQNPLEVVNTIETRL
jgi:hypothetical protein